MKFAAPLLVAAVLVVLCCFAEFTRQHGHYRALASRYAHAIAECANGDNRGFLIGQRIVLCEVVDTSGKP